MLRTSWELWDHVHHWSYTSCFCCHQIPTSKQEWQAWGVYGWELEDKVMSLFKGRGRSHATRPYPWMRYLALWGPAPAFLWDWARLSFPLPLYFSCLWVSNSTATPLSGIFSFISLLVSLISTSFYIFYCSFFPSQSALPMWNISSVHTLVLTISSQTHSYLLCFFPPLFFSPII